MNAHYRGAVIPLTLANRKWSVVLFGEVLADVFPDQTVLGGAPFNVARHLQAFGAHPVLITRLGNDALREKVLQVMSQNGMDTQGVQRSNRRPTGRVQVHIENGTHRFEILPQQAYDFIHPGLVRMTTLAANPALVYFGTLAQRNEVSRRALKTMLRSTGAAKFLDLNLRAPWYDKKTLLQSLQAADIVKLNDEELEMLANMLDLPDSDSLCQAQKLIERFDLDRVMVTSGELGAWHVDRDGKKIETPAHESVSRVVDTVGAGDAFSAIYILGGLRGWPLVKTLERANTFAAAICEIRGAIPDRADFYSGFKEKWEV